MKKRHVGEVINIDYGPEANGQWWWRERSNPSALHGPFATEAEAEKHSTDTLLGPDCAIEHGGQWDKAWERKQ